MKKWIGAAGLCVNEKNQLLMVLQGKPEEQKKWSVPSGGLEAGETIAHCCEREIFEETGYKVDVMESVKVKHDFDTVINIEVEVQYFRTVLIGGQPTIQDPDHLIHDIAWKSEEELKSLALSFPEDRNFLIDYVRSEKHVQS